MVPQAAFLNNKIAEFGANATNFDFLLLIQKSAGDYNNFDREFLSEKPKLSYSDKNLIDSMDQSAFAGFSFINPKFERILEK